MAEPNASQRSSPAPLQGAPPTRRQAALTALLASLVFLATARFAERHLSARVDLSEDGLSGWSDASAAIVGRLDDLLSVELFFTGAPKHAAAQLHRRRLLDAFDEFQSLAGDDVRVVLSDPNASFEDRQRAHGFRIFGVPMAEQSGTSRVQQNVYFGAVLRYRGLEEVVPFLSPVTLEYDVASAVHRLIEGERPRVGWFVGTVPVPEDERGDGPAFATDTDFAALRRHLEARYRVEDVFGLESGVRVSSALDALVLLAPRELAPRAAFEIEEYVRGGGSLVVLADRSRAEVEARRLDGYATGLEDLFAAWGAPVSDEVVWDRTSAHRAQTTSGLGGAAGTIEYPLWVDLREATSAGPGARFDGTSPVTARLRQLILSWAHPIEPAAPVAGVTRRWLAQSSENAWSVESLGLLEVDPVSIEATTRQLIAGDARPERLALAVALEGRFPAADANALGPDSLGPDALDPTSREPVPGTGRARRSEAAVPARVAIVGDADWARDRSVVAEEGMSLIGRQAASLLENLVDWGVSSDELVALRARVPSDRRLVDFERRALEAEGVVEAEGIRGATQRAERARSRARTERLTWTGVSIGGSLVLVAAIVAVAFARRRAVTVVEDAPERRAGGEA